MLNVLLKLLGVRVEGAARVVEGGVAFHGAVGIGWIFVAMMALGALAFWLYHRSDADVSPLRKYLLGVLRTVFLVLVLLLLLRPVLALTIEGSVRRMLVLLMDASSSMKIGDLRTDNADLKRVAMAYGQIDANKGLAQGLDGTKVAGVAHSPRVDVLKAALTNEKLDLLRRLSKDYDLRAYSFGQQLVDLTPARAEGADAPKPGKAKSIAEEFGWVEKLDAKSPVTAGGDAIREVIGRTRGQPLAGILLATDGAINSGSDPRAAAELAKGEGVPLFLYGVGISSPRDIVVANIFAQDVAFARDEVSATVRVRSQGMAGQTADLVLKLGDEEVDHKTVSFDADGEQVVSVHFTPKKAGEYELKAAIPPRPDEAVKDNNEMSQHLRVIDGKLKVLLVEQSPRWEFKYLQAMLLRDRRVDVKCVLLEGDPGIAAGEKTPYLPAFPASPRDLPEKFDMVILGDVDSRSFTGGQIDNIQNFVSQFGGGLLMIAGRKNAPWSYRGTRVEAMLPVEFEEAPAGPAAGRRPAQEEVADKPLKIELTAAGKRSATLRLSDKEQESAARWQGLPPIYWDARVTRAKPVAEVLVADTDPAKASRFGKMPLIAIQQYGLGQVMFVGTDNTWRWRKNNGDEYYTALWGQIVQRLSLPHLLGGSRRTQLTADRRTYTTGDRVTVYARLYNESFEPVGDPTVKGYYAVAGGREAEVLLRALPEQRGMYRAEFVAPSPGSYKFWVERDPRTQLDFAVTEPKMELGETAMNEGLLKELAKVSGGRFFREEDLHELPDVVRQRSERVRSSLEVELWSSPLYFLAMLAVVTAEWIVRKMSQMK